MTFKEFINRHFHYKNAFLWAPFDYHSSVMFSILSDLSSAAKDITILAPSTPITSNGRVSMHRIFAWNLSDFTMARSAFYPTSTLMRGSKSALMGQFYQCSRSTTHCCRETRYSCLRFTSVTMRGTCWRQACPHCIRLAYLFFLRKMSFHLISISPSSGSPIVKQPIVVICPVPKHWCSGCTSTHYPCGTAIPVCTAAHCRAEILSAITSNFIRSTFSKGTVQL